MKKSILVICTHNSARSQMAEGLINYYLNDKYIGYSAGTEKTDVNAFAILAMKDIGIDISHHKSKTVDEFMGEKFDFVVTVCDSAKESCPYFPGAKKYLHMGFFDPSSVEGSDDEKLAAFIKIRDEIKYWLLDTLIV